MSLAGISAFPLTPFRQGQLDEHALAHLVQRIVFARADSIGVLGSTGMYPYLNRGERRQAIEVAVGSAQAVPVVAGIGALATREVLTYARDAEECGASAVLLAPVSYHALTASEVYELFAAVTREVSLPVVIYDNPRTTGFTFSEDLYCRLSALPRVVASKRPVATFAEPLGSAISDFREQLSPEFRVGVSGDALGLIALAAGADVWFSAAAGTLPELLVPLAHAAIVESVEAASEAAAGLAPLWELVNAPGAGVRVYAEIAARLGLVSGNCLPEPMQPLSSELKAELDRVIRALNLA